MKRNKQSQSLANKKHKQQKYLVQEIISHDSNVQIFALHTPRMSQQQRLLRNSINQTLVFLSAEFPLYDDATWGNFCSKPIPNAAEETHAFNRSTCDISKCAGSDRQPPVRAGRWRVGRRLRGFVDSGEEGGSADGDGKQKLTFSGTPPTNWRRRLRVQGTSLDF